jgi:hypothetical protein
MTNVELLEYYNTEGDAYTILEENENYFIKKNDGSIDSPMTALPLCYVKSSLSSEEDIEIHDENNEVIGYLCLLNEKHKQVSALTEAQYIAYMYDKGINSDEEYYLFSYSYVIIKQDHYTNYITRYKDTSMLWGGYSHDTLLEEKYTKNIPKITVKSNILIPTTIHRDSLIKATASISHFERYLKYYHQLEILFNYIHVRKLINAGGDLSSFNKIVASYNREDIKNIQQLLEDYINDITKLEAIFNMAFPYLTIIKDIFYNFGKDSNPLKDETRWSKFNDLLTLQNLSCVEATTTKLVKNAEEYKTLLLKVTGYWIYRIRSSIAHNKIGEFIMEDIHQEFVVEIGEELLLEVIKQIFSSQIFHDDIQ